MKGRKWMFSILIFLTLVLPAIATTTLSAPPEEDVNLRVIIDYVNDANNGQKDPIVKAASGGCWATFSIWPAANLPMNYYIYPKNSEGFTSAYVVSTLKTGAETWDAVCKYNLFGDNPTTLTKATIGKRDGKNVIGFGNLQSGVIAATYLWGTTSALVEWDMKFNTGLVWGDAAKNPNVFDFLGIACHEFGHTFGMDDIYDGGCSTVTMYGYGAPGETFQRTLEQPDKDGVNYLYP